MNLEVFHQFAKKEKGRIIGKSNTAVIYTLLNSNIVRNMRFEKN